MEVRHLFCYRNHLYCLGLCSRITRISSFYLDSYMKYIFLFFALFSIHTVFAAPADCRIDPSSNIPADRMLADCAQGTIGISPGSTNTKETVRDTIKMVVNSAIVFGGLLAVGALVWSGIQYTTAYGDDEKLKKAKTTGIYALIGLILLMGSFGLVDIFINFIYTIAWE